MDKSNFAPADLYRLPWNMADNAISWLENTSQCNLRCDGCYRINRLNSHKTMDEIKRELEIFKRNRKTDSVSIAGGEPLLHPKIVEIVELIKSFGWKPVINTNGDLLTMDLLKDLKKAGVWGFTFHVDSGQSRPKWKGKNEIELNELRLKFASMLKEVGGITCSFNATVYPETVEYVPEILKWGQKHIDKVQTMVFIIYRMANLAEGFDYYVGNKQVSYEETPYTTKRDDRRLDISSPEIVDEIRKVYPDFAPSAFLNGTVKADTFKWLLTGRMGNKRRIFGYTGPKFMELVQTFKHIFTGSYLAYSKPFAQRIGRLYFLLSPFDKGIRNIAKNYFKSVVDKPEAFFSRVYYQSVMIIQPADVYENGEVNMCDGCPDLTVWGDEMVWSCRLEEQFRWGQNVRMVPRDKKDDSGD